MLSVTTSSLLVWIVSAFGVLCITVILVATKGSGFRNLWQLVKVDLLIRTLCITWAFLLLVQIFNALFSNPWRGTIILVGALLNIIMIILMGSILPGRLTKNRV